MPRFPARGFTLVEVMVVIVIIAILVTMVSLSMRGDRAGDQLEEEAKRLTALLNLLREETVMRDRDLGFVPTPEGYQFVQASAPPGLLADTVTDDEAQAAPSALPRPALPAGTPTAPSGTALGREASPEGRNPGMDSAAFLPLTDDSVFRARALPPGTVLRFEAGASTLAMPPAGQPYAPAILALAQDLLVPEGRLVLTHPATERVAAIRIRPDGAVIEKATDGR